MIYQLTHTLPCVTTLICPALLLERVATGLSQALQYLKIAIRVKKFNFSVLQNLEGLSPYQVCCNMQRVLQHITREELQNIVPQNSTTSSLGLLSKV